MTCDRDILPIDVVCDDLANPLIGKLAYVPAFGANDVVVRGKAKGFFVQGLVVTKLVALDETAFNEDVKCIVDGCTAYAIGILFHFDIKAFRIEMPLIEINLFKDGKALRSLSVFILFEVLLESLSRLCKDSIEGGGFYHVSET